MSRMKEMEESKLLDIEFKTTFIRVGVWPRAVALGSAAPNIPAKDRRGRPPVLPCDPIRAGSPLVPKARKASAPGFPGLGLAAPSFPATDRRSRTPVVSCDRCRLPSGAQGQESLRPEAFLALGSATPQCPCNGFLGAPEHDCLEVLQEVYSSRPDLRDRPLQNADLVLFTDGSSFLDEGKRQARYAVVSNFETIEAQALPEGWSAQRAELWALARVLELSKDKHANIYTDSHYAFVTLQLLEAVWEPKEIAVIHCKGHQKGEDSVSEGNQRADAAAKLAAKEQAAPARIMLAPELPEPPKYTPQEEKWAQKEGGKRTMEGWWILPDHRLAYKVVLQQHELTHLEKAALETLLGRYYLIAHLPSSCASVSQCCLLCVQNNAKQGPVGPIGVQRCGQAPFEDLEVDFTEIGPSRGNKYLLVFVCTFSGWVEAYPTRTEKAREVTKALLKDIIPRYGMPLTIGFDNGPAFVAEIVQQVTKALEIKLNLHTAYRPQSSGKVEHMNRTLKQAMAKLCQETTLPWTDILPLVLLRVCCAPRARVGFSPFEILYGRPPLLIWPKGNLGEIGNLEIQKQLQGLGKTVFEVHRTAVHPYKPGDQVWVKDWKKEPLKPTWKGPYPVILTTPTALKVAGLNTSIHHSRVKAAHQPSDSQPEWKVTSDQKHPCGSPSRRQQTWPSNLLQGIQITPY
ncbi:hypothetical protein QTO34_019821 [Cnephaeus nilssonii]|uniref:Uncharacterized protein n=1 Tax=Cnephaeus nilssonii TaxID=3371016 RepID=A0AA40HYF3_CNENI|nr:hypothetical protein QTO34_019821 [Eptesicus nilssonii]